MRYDVLHQYNPAYQADTWEELYLLYAGGYELLSEAQRFLPQMIGETTARYSERLKVASYMCYLGQIVDFFVANLFSHEIQLAPAGPDGVTVAADTSIDDLYKDLQADIDRKGTSLATLLRSVLTTGLVQGRALIGIDFPGPIDEAPATRAAEEALGLARAYAFEIPPAQLIDWDHDEVDGGFLFAVLKRDIVRRDGVMGKRGPRVEEYKVWERDLTGKARWTLYRTRPITESTPMRADETVPVVDSGTTTFPKIPILEVIIPPGLWVGNKIGPTAKEHFQRRNILTAAENKSLFAIPFVKLGTEVGAPGMDLPSEIQQNPNRARDPRIELANKGYLVIGSGDDVGFAEPAGGCYAVVESQLRDLKDEMFRVVHQMAASVSNIGASLGRSGDSKAEDRKATAVVLGALGAIMRDVAKRLFAAISKARGDDLIWLPSGLDQFDGDARDQVLAEATQIQDVSIPSQTFQKLWMTRLALALLPNLEPQVAAVVREEIDKGVAEQAKAKADLQTAMHELNGPQDETIAPQGAPLDARRGSPSAGGAAGNGAPDGAPVTARR
jgi:hypothetical protein